jgi:hypothetical protein
MSFTRYANFEDAKVLELKGAPSRQRTASLDNIGDYKNYRTGDKYLYVKIRAISSRINKNNDGWPSVELAGSQDIFDRHRQSAIGFTVEASEGNKEFGFATFIGKPIFVDHHNSDPKRARGVIVDSKLRVEPADSKTSSLDPYYSSEDVDKEHLPPTEIELLLEVDAKSFPKLAKEIEKGEIDGFSMGCFVAGTPITLHDGTKKPIEDIQTGDKVLTHTGKIESVTSTMERCYMGTTYTVETYGQSVSMTLTEEHPVWTQRGWVEAKNLQRGDHVLTPRFKNSLISVDPNWSTLIGWYLAEGNLGYDKKRYPDGRPVFAEWNLSVNETEYVEEIQTSLRELGCEPVGPYIKNNCATVRCNSPELALKLQKIAGEHSWGKKIDPRVMEWEVPAQRNLLDAYFKGDGYSRHPNKVEVGTASEDLAYQVQALCTRVNYRMTPPIKQHSPSAIAKRPKYSMYVTTEAEKQDNRFYLDDDGLWRTITKITPNAYIGPVYNFDVQGDDSYVAADIAVHNCDVERSKCSHCGNIATNPEEYCSHIVMKGAHHDFKTADGKRTSRKSYENCYGIKFFEISAVFDPADETALTKEIISSIEKEADGVYRPGDGQNYQIPEDASQLGEYSDAIACPTCHGGQYENPHGRGCPTCGDKGWVRGGNPGDDGMFTPHDMSFMADPQHRDEPFVIEPQRHPIDAPRYYGSTFEDEMRMKTTAASTHTAENPLPQSFETTAPQEIDTLRQEQICPICGSDMEGETCDVCGYVQPPKGFDNPDLDKAKKIDEEMEAGDEVTIQDDNQDAPPPGTVGDDQTPPKKPGSWVQDQQGSSQATKSPSTASIKGEMQWTPYVHQKVAGRLNPREIPVQVISKPVSNEPSQETVTSDQTTPVTAAMLTARHLITKAQQTGETMSQRNAQGPSPDDASPTTRVDVIGVGGVDQADNAAASKADAQVDVTGIGATGVSDVEPDSTEELPTASGDNSGFDKTKNQEDSGPTKTYGDSDGTQKGFTDAVTSEPFPASNEGVKAKVSYEDGVGDIQDGSPGSAVQGVQPSDPIGKAADRVDVLQAVTSPSNNSGQTSQWTGTEGNKVLRQQEPVTKEPTKSDGITAHFIAAIKLADDEVEALIIPKSEKYDRIAELNALSPEALNAQVNYLAKVKTASSRQQVARTASAGVTRLPSLFGKTTAASRGFDHITAGVDEQEDQPVDESILDSAVFSR